jgi:hypothetical protein
MPDPTAHPRPGIADTARALGVTFGGSLLVDGAAAAAMISCTRALARRRRPPLPAIAGAAAVAVYAAAGRSWMDSWGMRTGERPGHAVEIDAPREEVWPWLAQIGQDRAGFYSYEWLENLAGCRMHNADAIHPEWQEREVGEAVMLHWAHGLPVTRFEPARAIGLRGWGTFELEALPGSRTRLVACGEPAHGIGRAVYPLLVQLPHFVMERKMLLTIKSLAEAAK